MIAVLQANQANVLKRFCRFFAFGFFGLMAEIGLASLFIYIFNLPYQLSVGLAFLISITVGYFLVRRYVFYGTKRSVHSGYVYFVVVACVGILVVTAGTHLLVTYLSTHPLFARFLLGAVTGLFNYFINLVYNFKVADVH